MEFKFRAGDHRPPPPPPTPPPPPPPMQYPPPPGSYYLSKHGFPDAYLRRTTNFMALRNPFDSIKEMHWEMDMHWEMEFMRLREERLLAEIERQRFLKEEARRELMLFEREMALRAVAQSAGYSLRQPQKWVTLFNAAAAPSPSACPLPSSSQAVVVQSFHEWQKIEEVKSSDRLGSGAVAPPPQVQPLLVEDKKEPQVLEADKRELIVLEKPDPNVFREKRKAETTSTSTDNTQQIFLKKTFKNEDEWSCALCEVSVLNEKTFNEHLQGKKHKRNEANLKAQKEKELKREFCQRVLGFIPNKRRKLRKALEAFNYTAMAEAEANKSGETAQGEKTEGSFVKLGEKKEDNMQQDNQIGLGNSTTENDIVVKEGCETSKVGVYDSEVILAHVNGKEHQANLQEVGQTGIAKPSKVD